MKVLVAEDDGYTREGLLSILESEGYEAIPAVDGEEALRIFNEQAPDIVCLDIMMPGMNGYDVCRLIKSQDGSQNAEILAMTAYPAEEDVERVLRMGARVCLNKPLDMEQLLKEVDASL